MYACCKDLFPLAESNKSKQNKKPYCATYKTYKVSKHKVTYIRQRWKKVDAKGNRHRGRNLPGGKRTALTRGPAAWRVVRFGLGDCRQAAYEELGVFAMDLQCLAWRGYPDLGMAILGWELS